ncbi:hypothetical protein [Streptomyces sp. NPDC051162]|uniref:hypothetical protein n=1 Tax=Streptomyces sp. NPDC051162 TaxID=3154747 RepID=UPI0034292F32
MLMVESFLRDSEGNFIPVDQVTPPVPDPDYVEGALEFTVNEVEILSLAHWDYIDQLWSYIINMLEELRVSDSASTRFPDQPIELKFSRKGKLGILVQSAVGGVTCSAMVREGDLMAALRDSGVKFFQCMESLVPESADFHASELARLLVNCER